MLSTMVPCHLALLILAEETPRRAFCQFDDEMLVMGHVLLNIFVLYLMADPKIPVQRFASVEVSQVEYL